MQVSEQSLTRLQLSDRAIDLVNARKIGVALGPGIPIGLVDLGMLIALKQMNIKVSLISGTSMGAVMGALYASGNDPERIREITIDMFKRDEIRRLLKEDMQAPGLAFSSAQKLIAKLIEHNGWDPEFYELKVPLFVVASDKVSQKSIVIRHGRVWDAVRASMAIPFLVSSQKLGQMELADGAIFSQLDTDVLYLEDADFVIAIRAKPIRSERKRHIPVKYAFQSYLLRLLGWKIDPEIVLANPKCDILLRPRVPLSLASDRTKVEEIIDLGIRITYEAIDRIESGYDSKGVLSRSQQREKKPASANILEDIEDYGTIIVTHLSKLGREAAKMSDADLMHEFPKFEKMFREYIVKLTQEYPKGEASERLRNKMERFAELFNDSPFVKRCLEKPLGYAGDYQMMNYLYDNDIFEARSNVGKFLNYYTFLSPTANAVRNRAKIIQGLVMQKLSLQHRLKIASIACGPAREISETIKLISVYDQKYEIIWTLLDQDQKALDYAQSQLPESAILKTEIVNAGVRELINQTAYLGNQDLIYSLGLFDYLEDKVAILLIQTLFDYLNPGGVLLIGNFSPGHADYTFIEGISEWHLILRSEDDLLNVGKKGAPQARHFVMAEPEGLNLILVVTKPL